MTRFGVMKHLKQLEDAGLVVTRRQGREKLHFLNPVPIRLVHDRWVSKYAEPWAAGLSGLKQELETSRWRRCSRSTSRRRPSGCGTAITDPEVRAKYNFGAGAHSDWTPGSHVELQAGRLPPRRRRRARGRPAAHGSCTRCWPTSAPKRRPRATSRVTWEIEPVGDSCRLTVVHDQMREGANEQIYGGWPMILSGLKTWLETRRAAHHPGLAHVHLTRATEGHRMAASDAPPALRPAGLVHTARVQPRRWPSSPAPGVSVWGSRELRVRGRTSGEWRTTPVNLLTLDGEQYLVAPRGETQWVRNLRSPAPASSASAAAPSRSAPTEVADADKVADPARLPEALEGRGRRVLRRRERRLPRRRPPAHRPRPPRVPDRSLTPR